jgi:feruloyl-CoA synthase
MPYPRFTPPSIELEARPDGVLLLRSRQPLAEHPPHLGAVLRQRAEAHPDRVFLAERQGEEIRSLTYGQVWSTARRLASRMLEDGLGPGRPVMVLSDNSVDHALVTLGALVAGVPAAPVSPAYSLLSRDHAKLRAMHALLRPGWIYADDGAAYATALAALALTADTRVIHAESLAALLAEEADASAVDAVFAHLGPDTVAKVLFTSGSTGDPKGVITTHGMLAANQQAIAQGWPFLEDRPPVVVDWLPWSHCFGGNHNFNLVLWHGGTLWVDRGKPVPGRIEETVATLRRVSPTVYFNVPRGFDALLPYLESDEALARTFFADLDLLFYAAAALPRTTWDRLAAVSRQVRGEAVPFVSAWGSTETAPMVTQVCYPCEVAGNIGVPAPGVTLKLVPTGDKLEVRVRGPQLTPGYFKDQRRWQEALDEEGFYRIGDAVRLADPHDPSRGLLFDGRVAEDFKLTSGTWVHAGALRIALIQALAPLVQDAVIAGHDREAIGVLLFPDLAACAKAIGAEPGSLTPAELLADENLRTRIAQSLASHNAEADGATSRIVHSALLLAEPPSIDAGEITDKGYINQRAVLERRAEVVEALFRPGAAEVIRVGI